MIIERNQIKVHLPVRRHRHERGSALLIVFVFAAIVAILLYREMPIAAFEARRQKEQRLVDRGHEYQRAVQLYYRKFQGRYPANIEVLENSNNLRFLRRRYKDPFTGKDDWRLLHAGPGGQIIDSKVRNSIANGIFGQNGANSNGQGYSTLGAGLSGGSPGNGFGGNSSNSNTGANSTSSSSFGSSSGSSFGSSDSSSDPAVTVAPVARRAPVISASGPGAGNGTPSSNELDQDPSTPLLPAQVLPAQDPNAPAQPDTAQVPPATQTQPVAQGGPTGVVPSQAQQGQTTGASALGQNGATTAFGQNSAGGGLTSTNGSTGILNSGGLAGVASKAKGHAIKKINEQTDYSLWEFWYDPTKDTSMGTPGVQQNGNGGLNVNAGAPGVNSRVNNGINGGVNTGTNGPFQQQPNQTIATPAQSTSDNSNTGTTSQPAQPQPQ